MFLFLRQVSVTVTQWSLTLRDLMYSSQPDSCPWNSPGKTAEGAKREPFKHLIFPLLSTCCAVLGKSPNLSGP